MVVTRPPLDSAICAIWRPVVCFRHPATKLQREQIAQLKGDGSSLVSFVADGFWRLTHIAKAADAIASNGHDRTLAFARFSIYHARIERDQPPALLAGRRGCLMVTCT